MQFLPPALAALGSFRQFLVCLYRPSSTRPGKTDKFPVDYRTGLVCNAHDPAVWTDSATACAVAAALGPAYGAAFVFTERDPFWFLDLDDCLQADGTWSPLATQLLSYFPGAAVEVSNSGRGLHLFGCGTVPDHGCKNVRLGLEFYTGGRFVALTGTHAQGRADLDFSDRLAQFVAYYVPPTVTNDMEWADAPRDDWSGPVDDEQLIETALNSKSAGAIFTGKATFRDLWEAHAEALARSYPDSGVREFDRSSADAALAQHLAFWTGNDCERVRRLMYRSALVRDKWGREDYLPRTILRACAAQTTVATGWAKPGTSTHDQAIAAIAAAQPSPGPVATESPGPTWTAPDPTEAQMLTGPQYMPADLQRDHFRGCVYVRDMHRVLVPGGHLLKSEQFRVVYGGYTFPMDAANEKVSRNAWEAFTESQAVRFPKVDGVCFRPELDPGRIVQQQGQALVNVWWPAVVERVAGDVSPFLHHLALLLPNEHDRAILLAYMAACVQHIGTKFQWAPLIQGAPGNGKTLLTRCVANAIGKRYVHWPKAMEIDSRFNGWLLNKLLIAVEDIYVPEHKQSVLETLKPMITGGDGLEIQLKGVDQISADICANFMLNSNHLDAIRKTRDDRRFAVFYTAQQSAEDLERDGMGGDYFPNLYGWLNAGGYALVAHYLAEYAIPAELNPAVNAIRAPMTTSTEAAIAAGLGRVEQEVAEAIEQGLPGFAGGWVSSIMLERLLEKTGDARRIPPNKRRDLMKSLGYDWHPGLAGGRVNNVILPDSGKPRLFLKRGHLAGNLRDPGAIAKAYTAAQAAQPVTKAAAVFGAVPAATPPPQ